jgi:hypothetical protein
MAISASTDTWLTPGLIVAICALIFTVASFWWLNARQGRLKSFEPHTFAATITLNMIRLRLPLVFHNTGAVPIIVQNLRIRFSTEPAPIGTTLPWVATRSQIKPDSDDGHAFPAVFSVAGRTAQQIFVEFGASSFGFVLGADDYPVQIEAKLGHSKDWQFLVGFVFRAWHISDPTSYITYENTPSMITEDQRAKVRIVLRDAQLGQEESSS